jgi:cell division protein FtsB
LYYTVLVLEFQEKKKVKRLMFSKVTLVILVVIAGVLINAVWSVYKKREITKENLNKTRLNLEGLEQRQNNLSVEIGRLKTEAGIEEEIREKYGLVKPGEEVITIVHKSDGLSTSSLGSDSKGFWQKVLDWLK